MAPRGAAPVSIRLAAKSDRTDLARARTPMAYSTASRVTAWNSAKARRSRWA